MPRTSQSSRRETSSRGASAAAPIDSGTPRVVVTSPVGLRLTVLAFVLPVCGWLVFSAFETRSRFDAVALLAAGLIWFSFLRMFAQRLEFGADSITFRAAVFTYVFPRRSVDRVSLYRAGKTARLDLGDGAPFHAQVLDWNRPRHESARRERLAELLREIPHRPFEVSVLHHAEVGRWRPAAATERDVERVRPTHSLAPLRPSESLVLAITVIAAVALAVFGS